MDGVHAFEWLDIGERENAHSSFAAKGLELNARQIRPTTVERFLRSYLVAARFGGGGGVFKRNLLWLLCFGGCWWGLGRLWR